MPVTVRSIDEGFAEAVRWHLAPFKRPAPPSWGSYRADVFIDEEDAETDPAAYSFFFQGERDFRSRSLPELLFNFLWKIHAQIPKGSDDFLFLHAGAASWDNAGLLLPARMDSGKSSLTLALLQAGLTYLSDEFGAIDPITRQAYPVQKRVKLDQRALDAFPGLERRLEDPLVDRPDLPVELRARYVRPEDVGAEISGPVEIRWLVFPSPDWNGPPRLEPLGRAAAVEEMAKNAFNLDRYEGRGVILLSIVASGAQAFRIVGGTPSERASLINEELFGRAD
jgi:hypothetical protein